MFALNEGQTAILTVRRFSLRTTIPSDAAGKTRLPGMQLSRKELCLVHCSTQTIRLILSRTLTELLLDVGHKWMDSKDRLVPVKTPGFRFEKLQTRLYTF